MAKQPTYKRPEEPWLYGLSQVLALFETRPEDLKVILYQRERRALLGALFQFAAQKHLPYREVSPEELVSVTGSVHHEGVAVKASLPPLCSLEEASFEGAQLFLGLDRVGNPHNVGAILRSAAYFGVDGVIFSEDEAQAKPSAAVLRTAEGGAERVKLIRIQSLGRAQVELKRRGFTVIGTDANAPRSLFEAPLPRPCLVIVGNEAMGLSESVRSRCDLLVSIPGVGRVDSLNVSAASAVVLAELFRTRPR